ncbi:MAG TPA: acyltransferase [Prosthecobacter sp.]|nr:acyltransferase [Prosthecobacter sp.]
MSVVLQKIWRRLALLESPLEKLRKLHLRLRGAVIGKGTRIPRVLVTWPHQIQLGRDCTLQPDIFFNYSHFWMPGPSMIFGDRVFIGRGCEFNIREKIILGDDCLIASGCTFVDSNHGTDALRPMNAQHIETAPIVLGRNVWLGAQCVVLKGVQIGDGAIVGAGSVLTKSVPAGEMWAGVPARRIRPVTTHA